MTLNLINTEILLNNRIVMGETQQILSVSDFYTHSYPDTKELKRKKYEKEYYQKNKERINKRNIDWNRKNPEKKKLISRLYYLKYKQEINQKSKEWRKSHPERAKEYKHQYDIQWYSKNREKCLESVKKWAKTHPEMKRENMKRYYKNHPERYIAMCKAERNIKLDNKKCEFCGDKKDLHRHHLDYSKPLDVIILCRNCHRLIHKEC